jgi:hypothetical protein
MILFPWDYHHRDRKRKKRKRRTSERFMGGGEFKEKDVNDKEYPPLFKLDIIRDIGLSFPVQIKCHLEVPSIKKLFVIV